MLASGGVVKRRKIEAWNKLAALYNSADTHVVQTVFNESLGYIAVEQLDEHDFGKDGAGVLYGHNT